MTLNPLAWLEDIVSWILVQWHAFFSIFFSAGRGSRPSRLGSLGSRSGAISTAPSRSRHAACGF